MRGRSLKTYVLVFSVVGLVTALSAGPEFLNKPSLDVGTAEPGDVAHAGGAVAADGAHTQALEHYKTSSLAFERNEGQADSQVEFISRGPGYTLFLTRNEAVLAMSAPSVRDQKAKRSDRDNTDPDTHAVLRMELVSANPAPSVEGIDELPDRANYLIGSDPQKWHTGVRRYGRVLYRDIYPNVDLVFYGNQGRLEYDFIVGPGGDPSAISLRFDGASAIERDDTGDLILHTSAGEVRQRKPIVYQEGDDGRRHITGEYVVEDVLWENAPTGKYRVGFQVSEYDTDKALVIDPVLEYSTYLGGSDTEITQGGFDVDDAGNAYITGNTRSTDFPLVSAFQDTFLNGPLFKTDVFVTKLNASGAVVYSTYLGGTGDEWGDGIAADNAGNAYVTGFTRSADFPTANPYQGAINGTYDAFVTKLDATGGLVYSTYLGGSGFEEAHAIAVDDSGNVYVVGRTDSGDYPLANPFQATIGGGQDGFVTKLNAAGSALTYSTYLGGDSPEQPNGIAVDTAGNAYVAGMTGSGNFPTVNAFQAVKPGVRCAFVTKFDPAGSASGLVYSTFLGGSGLAFGGDAASAIAIDDLGSAYVVGFSVSTDFPLKYPFQSSLSGSRSAFVTKLDPAGSATGLVYSTYLGGGGTDEATGIAVDAVGSAWVVGWTNSGDFPSKKPIQGGAGSIDAFVTKLDPRGSAADGLLFSSHLGGSGDDRGFGIGVNSAGQVCVAGYTRSSNFPTVNPYQAAYAGVADAFIARLSADDVPVALQRFDARWAVTHVEVSWTLIDIDGELGIEVYRSAEAGGSDTRIHDPDITRSRDTFILRDGNVERGTTYRYRVLIVENGEIITSFEVTVATPALAFVLGQNHPNPFNPSTRIDFTVDRAAHVYLAVYGVSGKLVRTLVDQPMLPGTYSREWNGNGDGGYPVASGVYFYRLSTGTHTATRKAVLLK